MSFAKISYNDRRLAVLSFLLFLPILLDFLIVVRGAQNSAITLMIYALSEIVILIWAIRESKLANWIAILMWFLLSAYSYLITQSEYFISPSFLIIAVYFIPIGALVIFRIDNYNNFFQTCRPFSIAGILIGVYIVAFSGSIQNGIGDYFSYMEFSYNLLPCTISLYVVGRKEKRLPDILLGLIGLGSMLSFGARAAVLYAFVFITIYELLIANSNKWALCAVIIIALLIFANIESIFRYLIQFQFFQNSRFIGHYLQGEAFESSSREIIFNSCINRIETMGIAVFGFFGDRAFLHGTIYPHNIVYEIMMDFGWICGPMILIWITYLLLKDYFVKNYRLMILYAIFCLLGRYFISGSYVIEGRFWIFLFIILSISRYCPSLNSKPLTNQI